MLFFIYFIFFFIIYMLLFLFIYVFILGIFMIIFMLFLLNDKSSVFSENFECGFYPILIQMLKYKFNYWMITIHFLIFELELCLLLLLCFKFKDLNENCILAFLFIVLFCDLLIYGLFVFICSYFIWIISWF